jgi:endoglucanase
MNRRLFLTLALGGAATLAQGKPANEAATPATLWAEFKRRYVLADGRVVDTGNKGISHSEGQGVAMLFAALEDDAATFDRLWTWTRDHLRRPDGLFSWQWVQGKGVTDKNNASDGELYIAWALARAGARFRQTRYVEEARATAKALREHCVVQVPAGTLLLPGADGFVKYVSGVPQVVVNNSYWVFPAIRELALIDPSPVWGSLRETGLKLLMHARFGPHELPSDWLQMSEPAQPWVERPARFGHEAIRVPLFLYWAGEHQHPALVRFARFAAEPGFPAWVGADGRKAEYKAPVGFEAVAQLARGARFRAVPAPLTLDSDYFSSSLVLLSALAAREAPARS